jgi:hypothetical protein
MAGRREHGLLQGLENERPVSCGGRQIRLAKKALAGSVAAHHNQ